MSLNSDNNKFVVVGKIAGVYGVKGQLKIHSYTSPEQNILNYKPLYWKINDEWQLMPLVSNSLKKLGKNIVFSLENCIDRDEAKKYYFIEIATKRTNLPSLADNEYYWTDLYGLEVYTVFRDQDSPEYLGIVDHIMETGANDVLVVNKPESAKGAHLIPYVMDQFVISIDLDAKKIIVNWDPEF